ncbi:transcription elongation factor Spt5 [Candidatus Micrarchaeota archaeon]|nr:transcription elongation factor Spt5 [Candidatus Micrarchaeota archaeon]
MIFVYRVTAGQEKVVADVLRKKIEKDKRTVTTEDVEDAKRKEAGDRIAKTNELANSQPVEKRQAYLEAVPTVEKKLEELKTKDPESEDYTKAREDTLASLNPTEKELIAYAVGKNAIYALAAMDDMRGYLLVESSDEVAARQAAIRIPHIKGVLSKPMSIEELTTLVEKKPAALSFKKADIVELMSGPFKGEKARIIRIDENKEEVTVELTEVAVPIPVTIKISIIRLYKKAEDA